MEQNN
ncbi:hypothetical protein R3I93_022745 [Phoxinus phoxinus]|jgi:deoxyhypusine synthase